MTDAREHRIARVIGAVARQAIEDRGLTFIALLDLYEPEAQLAHRMLWEVLGEDWTTTLHSAAEELELVLHAPVRVSERTLREETLRVAARLRPGALIANPANKTALLLGGALPPDPFFPLGDVWASDVAELAGGWSAPDDVVALAERAGGIEALDRALRGAIDARDPSALDALPAGVGEDVRAALARGRAARVGPVLVPKIGARTIGIDLDE